MVQQELCSTVMHSAKENKLRKPGQWNSYIIKQRHLKDIVFQTVINFEVLICKLTNGKIICLTYPRFCQIIWWCFKTFISIINHISLDIKAVIWNAKHLENKRNCNTYTFWTIRTEFCNELWQEATTKPILFNIFIVCWGERKTALSIRFVNKN